MPRLHIDRPNAREFREKARVARLFSKINLPCATGARSVSGLRELCKCAEENAGRAQAKTAAQSGKRFYPTRGVVVVKSISNSLDE